MAQSEKLAQLLTRRWTMLAESCETERCYTPLMENKRGDGDIMCVGCNARYTRLNDALVRIDTEPLEEKEPIVVDNGDENELDSLVAQYDRQQSATNEQQQKNRVEKDDQNDQNDDGEMQRRCAERRQKSDAASHDMGQLLLQGWMMLAEYCPRCFTPFMRNPETMDMLCVSCHATTLSKENQEIEKQKQLNEAKQRAKIEEKIDVDRRSRAIASSSTSMSTPTSTSTSSPKIGDDPSIVVKTKETLWRVVERMQRQLDDDNAVDSDLERARQRVALIGESLRALAFIKS
jgi:uncharacterized Zn finger protein (UPF0148 family)